MQKVTFSLPTLPPGGAFELVLRYGTFPKNIIHIFDTLSIKVLIIIGHFMSGVRRLLPTLIEYIRKKYYNFFLMYSIRVGSNLLTSDIK